VLTRSKTLPASIENWLGQCLRKAADGVAAVKKIGIAIDADRQTGGVPCHSNSGSHFSAS
jgi:hypothetical protein